MLFVGDSMVQLLQQYEVLLGRRLGGLWELEHFALTQYLLLTCAKDSFCCSNFPASPSGLFCCFFTYPGLVQSLACL